MRIAAHQPAILILVLSVEKVRHWRTFSTLKTGEFVTFGHELPGFKFIMRIAALAYPAWT